MPPWLADYRPIIGHVQFAEQPTTMWGVHTAETTHNSRVMLWIIEIVAV